MVKRHIVFIAISQECNKRVTFVKIVSEYDQEIPQPQTKQTNQLSLPHQDDFKTRTDIKQRTTKHRTISDSHNGSKVSKGAKIRNRYNQEPHLTQDTNGK